MLEVCGVGRGWRFKRGDIVVGEVKIIREANKVEAPPEGGSFTPAEEKNKELMAIVAEGEDRRMTGEEDGIVETECAGLGQVLSSRMTAEHSNQLQCAMKEAASLLTSCSGRYIAARGIVTAPSLSLRFATKIQNFMKLAYIHQ
ncbi:hypothetical protein IFR05_006184 [Cadophora sp. M221]|nr:hypothetical protein IFR05_006184 [Cadophora sp. M221]